MNNSAAYLLAPKSHLTISPSPTPQPGPGEVLIHNTSISLNSLEPRLQAYAILPITYPAIIGNSFAGTIIALGPDITTFAIGDKVAALRNPMVFDDPAYGSFQKYVLAKVQTVAKLHLDTDEKGLDEASAVILNAATAVSAASVHLNLGSPVTSSFPAPGSQSDKGKVLVYGGSSPLGALAVKYITDLGYEVVTTSSPAKRDWVLKHGAKTVIDHSQAADEIVKVLKANGPYAAGIFDAIGSPPVNAILGELMVGYGGGKYLTVLPNFGPPMPNGVERVFNPYTQALIKEENLELGKWLVETYLPKGLKEGWLIPSKVEKVNGGLAVLQDVLDRINREETGGKKLIVDPSEE